MAKKNFFSGEVIPIYTGCYIFFQSPIQSVYTHVQYFPSLRLHDIYFEPFPLQEIHLWNVLRPVPLQVLHLLPDPLFPFPSQTLHLLCKESVTGIIHSLHNLAALLAS